MRQALAGMLWSKQYYSFELYKWLEEHGADPLKPGSRSMRNKDWFHMINDDNFKIECPTGSGNLLNLFEVAREIGNCLSAIFLRDGQGRRPRERLTPLCRNFAETCSHV
jgi:hypothetical protein